jgi:hypothetical protein
MQSFRKRIAVQKQHIEHIDKTQVINHSMKDYIDMTRAYIQKALLMYHKAAASFVPLSDEEAICRDEIIKLTADLEIINNGTYEERKEVVKKYGKGIG